MRHRHLPAPIYKAAKLRRTQVGEHGVAVCWVLAPLWAAVGGCWRFGGMHWRQRSLHVPRHAWRSLACILEVCRASPLFLRSYSTLDLQHPPPLLAPPPHAHRSTRSGARRRTASRTARPAPCSSSPRARRRWWRSWSEGEARTSTLACTGSIARAAAGAVACWRLASRLVCSAQPSPACMEVLPGCATCPAACNAPRWVLGCMCCAGAAPPFSCA